MGGKAVLCSNDKCGYYGYPAICKDCKRNSLGKEGKYDLYYRKDDNNVSKKG